MNKTELIEKMADRADTTKKQAEHILNAFIAITTEEVAGGGEVKLVGFGNFVGVDVKEREGRNPRTGEAMTIPAKRKPKFEPGAVFRREVAEA